MDCRTAISSPSSAPIPCKKGLLYAGTDAGVYVSFDDGDAWQPLQRNLPVAWVRDLLVHGNDLIAATQGRAIWVLDDVTPLRQIDASIAHADAHLFAPAPAIRVRGSQNKDTPPPADTALGTNPPTGAIIDYTLGKSAKQVVIEIRERTRRRQAARRPPLRERRQDAADQGRTLLRRSVDETRRETVNRTRRAPLRLEPALAAAEGGRIQLFDRGRVGRGHAADAGRCAGVAGRLRRRAHRRRRRNQHQTLTVAPDPRIHATRAELEQAFAFYRDVEGELAKAWQTYGEVDAVHEQLEALHKNEAAAKAKGAIEAFEKKLSPFREGKGEGAPNIGTIAEALTSLATDVEGADAAPTDAQQKVFAEYRGRLARASERWSATKQNDLATLNRSLAASGVKEIHVPSADEIRIGEPSESKDLP